jgi:outer membrane protein OmpA-like peptidoglycan-associated protein
MVHHKFAVFGLALLLVVSGCRRDKASCDPCKEIDMPMGDNQFHRLFDSSLETELEADDSVCDFTWTAEDENEDGFRNVYFTFDGKSILEEQKDALAANIETAKACLVANEAYNPTLIIEGHACSSAGREAYNMAISEARAKQVYQACLEAGVPAERMKIVGRGQEVPAVIDGAPVTGDRLAQAPNRRCEMHVIYA